MPKWIRFDAEKGEVAVTAPKDTTENVYVVTIKHPGQGIIRFQTQTYITIEDFKKRFNSANPSPDDRAAATWKMRLKQLQTILCDRGETYLAKRAIDWSMEYVERPDLPPFENTPCLKCKVPRYRCSC